MNLVIGLTHHSLWLGGRASERGIRRFEVRFLMGTHDKTKKPASSISLWVYAYGVLWRRNLTSSLSRGGKFLKKLWCWSVVEYHRAADI